jgi:hypothetical protein
MSEDEFFRRIAETEPEVAVVPTDRPAGTASRRAVGQVSSKSAPPASETRRGRPSPRPARRKPESSQEKSSLVRWRPVLATVVLVAGVAVAALAVLDGGGKGSGAIGDEAPSPARPIPVAASASERVDRATRRPPSEQLRKARPAQRRPEAKLHPSEPPTTTPVPLSAPASQTRIAGNGQRDEFGIEGGGP